MMNKLFLQNGKTCGIEFETDFITQSKAAAELSGSLANSEWRVTHDASIETDTQDCGYFISLPGKNIPPIISYSRTTLGAEIVSTILDSEEDSFFKTINKLCNWLIENGEPRESERSGIHFHISLANPSLVTLKNILRLGRHYERLFFDLAGLGYKFRGTDNDSIYCRPITSFGPPVIMTERNGYAQVFNLDDVLETKTLKDFWYLFGDLPENDTRYTPSRYIWLNPTPMFQGQNHRGTLEFRIWNKCLTPEFIYATFMLCKGFVNATLKYTYSDLKRESLTEENSVFEKGETSDQFLLDELCSIGEVDPKSKSILDLILKRNSKVLLQKGYVYSHLNGRQSNNFWRNYVYTPKELSKSQIRRPNFVDIHVLRGES